MTIEPPSSCSILVAMEAEWKLIGQGAGMTSTLAGPDRRPERILLHQLRIQRDIGGHLAIIFEVDAPFVEDAHGFLTFCERSAGRMTQGGIGENRHAGARSTMRRAKTGRLLWRCRPVSSASGHCPVDGRYRPSITCAACGTATRRSADQREVGGGRDARRSAGARSRARSNSCG